MKKKRSTRRWGRIVLVVLTIGCLLNIGTVVNAATFNSINQPDVFLKQQAHDTCTLVSAVMMVRRAAIATGNSNWKRITEETMRGSAWLEDVGMYYSFSYAGISVQHAELAGGSANESQLISLLAEHPEGLVIFDRDIPHAILLTDYSKGVFYSADPSGGTPAGRIPVSSASVAVNNADEYWYVSSPTVRIKPNVTGTRTVPDGDYQIVTALNSGYKLDVNGTGKSDGTNVQIYSSTTQSKQVFSLSYLGNGLYSIKHNYSGRYLDVSKDRASKEANVQLRAWNNSNTQKWVVEDAGNGYVSIVSKYNGKYLDVAGRVAKKGTNVRVYTDNNSASQKWRLVSTKKAKKRIADGRYYIVLAGNTSYGLDISGASKSNDANVQLFKNRNNKSQLFQVTWKNNGYEIISVNSRKNLDAADRSAVAGTNLLQHKKNNKATQRWRLEPAGNGAYYIINAGNNLAVDVAGKNIKNGANIQLFLPTNAADQKWKFVKQ